jgi:type I restriction enzyme S subunit
MEVKPGYKQTEVGIIPEDWGSVAIGSLASFSSGQGIDIASLTEESSDRPIPVYGGNGIAGYTALALTKGPTVVVGRVGQKCGEVYLTEGPAWVTDNALYPRRYRDQPDIPFLALAMQAAGLNSVKNRNDLPLITQSILHSVCLPIPPTVTEQRAIADALRDVDALLAGLDRLISKKGELKRAVMQKLLTGEVRLPGFDDEWDVRRLGDHVRFLRNGVNSRADLVPDGRVKYLHYGDVHACKDVYLTPASMPCLPDARTTSLDRLRDGDLIIADASEDVAGVTKSVEMRGVGGSEVVAGLHTIAARFDKTVLADGFKGYLQFCPPFATHVRRLAAGTKVYATNRAHVATVEMRLPSVPEQVAIATVLSDMDAELAALDSRRAKTRGLKQAMMQELLTGKIRLIAAGVGHA